MITFTVFYEGPFWVGVFERVIKNKLYTAKITFGAEPNDEIVYNYILNEASKLRYNIAVTIDEKKPQNLSFKRQQREAKKTTQKKGVGTKAQQALKLERDFKKQQLKKSKKEKLEAMHQDKFNKKQQKKKLKKKGH